MDINQPPRQAVSPDSVISKPPSPVARSPVNYLSNQTFAQKLLQNDMFPNMVDAPTSSLIVKLVGRKLGYPVLKRELQDLWKLSEELIMIDLGCDFYLIKFTQMQNMLHVLHDGPWFIFNNFLSVQKWEPKFVASQARITHTAIWIRLQELPTEFYDMDVLQKVAAEIGLLLKVDFCTSTTSRSRYARLCVQVPLEQSLLHHLFIGNHKQIIRYEVATLLCTNCG
ncbi:uncharacterized protein At4g02000-like [Capsicum annuum]|uniref:uncharacterized protein At4g02000-like n=1 Tax=Capsicum annuum TaxID=4072 RepID=UPI0007BEF669|nr:uncharacterized protein At4g02000-like [Capsicum annuum]